MLFSLSPNIHGIERTKKWHEDASFWTSFICSARNSRSFGIYQIYTNYSYRLREFVKRFTPNLYMDCQSLLYLRTYKIYSRDYADGIFIIRQTRYPRTSKRAVIENSIRLKVPAEVSGSAGSHFIDTPAVTVILIDSEESLVGFLNHVVPEEWNNTMKFLIIMITDNNDSTQVENPKHVADNILKRLWRERQILNVIFVAPFTTFESCAFTYNPISSFAGQDITGEIEIFKFESSDKAATTMAKIYARNLNNLHGYPLKVGMFERIPTSLRLVDKVDHGFLHCKKTIIFTGIDGLMLDTVAEAMNFTTVIYRPTDGIEFGYQMQNGTYVGTLGDIVSKKIDVSFNAMFIKKYGNDPNAIKFSSYVAFDKLCLVVPKASKIPQWLRIFQSFTPTLWLYLGIVQIVCGATWYIIQRRDRPSEINFLVVLLDTTLLFAGAPRHLPLITSGRILIGSLLLLSVTITGIFNGSLYKSFSTDSYYKDIDELKDVDESGLQIGTGSPNLRDMFGCDNDSEIMVNLRKKFSVIPSSDIPAIERTAYFRNFSAVDRENDLLLRLNTKYIDRDGNHMLHIVSECPRTYSLGYAGHRNSIFFDRMNVIISRTMEAGLTNYWYAWTIDNYLQKNSTRQFIRTQQKFVGFHLYDVQTSFFILAFGLFLSLLVFIGEHVVERRVEIYFKMRQWSCSVFNIPSGTERRTYA
ncbi:uncharacterized protein LOC107275120 isoform X2 [Cephus cinctus]|uniref:Uncharacterized protein LOC107275120 isoform X2 n=1 Tax=Cephus cinctus TaxID=211228 RepID=A0AAJ7RVC4_CEPCN|nr:uncharacterized protein LOC107275120 isoform X2 [Cephus cinctus]